MKIPKIMVSATEYEQDLRHQLDLLIDIMPFLESLEDKESVFSEILAIRQGLKRLDKLVKSNASSILNFTELTFRSELNNVFI